MPDVAAGSSPDTWPKNHLSRFNSAQEGQESACLTSVGNCSVSEGSAVPTNEPAVAGSIKVTRSSRLREGSYDENEAFPYKNNYSARNVAASSMPYLGKSPNQEVAVPPESNQVGNNDAQNQNFVSHTPTGTKGASSLTNIGSNNSTAQQQLSGGDGSAHSLPKHYSIENNNIRSMPQCHSCSPTFVDCMEDSIKMTQTYSAWSREIEASISMLLFGTGQPLNKQDILVTAHWTTLIHIFYGALTHIYSPIATSDEITLPVDDKMSSWLDLYYSMYFSVPANNHYQGKGAAHKQSRRGSASSSSVYSARSVTSESSFLPYYFFVSGASLLWDEVCKRFAETDAIEASDAVNHRPQHVTADDVLSILLNNVKVLGKIVLHASSFLDKKHQREIPLSSCIAQGVLIYFPNENCVAYGAFLWNTYATANISMVSSMFLNPHVLLLSACIQRLSSDNGCSDEPTVDILSLSSWTFQLSAISSIDAADMYSFHLLSFHCLSSVQSDSFWEKNESSSLVDSLLKKTGQLLFENCTYFLGRVFAALKLDPLYNVESFEDNALFCKLKVIRVIQIHITDCEAWFRLRCERPVPTFGLETRGQNYAFVSEQMHALVSGYRILFVCLEERCVDKDASFTRDEHDHIFSHSLSHEAKAALNEVLGASCTGLQRNHALRICGEAAHLFGQSLTNLYAHDYFTNKEILPHVREFFTVALKFYDLADACPKSCNWEDDADSNDEIFSEEKSLSTERSLVLMHLATVEENALDYTSAIGHYKEAVAILRNPACWRYIISMLSGNHWGDNADFDESVQSMSDCNSEPSGSGISSLSVAPNLTLALHRIGVCYLNSGAYGSAIECLRQAAELRKKELIGLCEINSSNSHHAPNTRREREVELAETLQWLATAYREEGKPERAYEVIRDCLIVKLLLFGKKHIEVGNVQFNMGVILDDMSRHSESLECYKDALQIQRYFANSRTAQVLQSVEAFDKTETDIVNTLLCMGNLFHRVVEDDKKALDCFIEALQILEKVVRLASVASTVDGAKSLGGVDSTHICSGPKSTALKLARRQENGVIYARMTQYYILSYDIISKQHSSCNLATSQDIIFNSTSGFGKDWIATPEIFILTGLSFTYMAQMKWKLAKETLKKKLFIMKKRLNEVCHAKNPLNEKVMFDEAYELTLYNLANIFFKLGEFKKAQRCYNDVLDAWKLSHTDLFERAHCIADALHNKGCCLKEMNLIVEALRCFEESLKWRDKADSVLYRTEFSVFKANTWYHVGSIFLLQNKCDEAKKMFDQCLAVYKINDSCKLSEAFVLHGIGKIHQLKENSSTALDYYSVSLQIYRDVAGKDENFDPSLSKELAYFIAESYHNIGTIHDIQKHFDVALVNYEEALQLYRSNLGPRHCSVAITLNNMGLVLIQQQRFSDALLLFKEALEIRKEQLGENHADVAQVWHNMGLVYDKLASRHGQASLTEAVDCFKKALRIRMQIYGESNLDVSNTWTNLGISYTSMADYDNAIGCFNNALQIRIAIFGVDHIEVGNANHNLGNLYAKTGDFAKALEAYEISYKIRVKAFGPEHVSVSNTIHNMGNVYYRLGDKERAKDLYVEALKMRDSSPSSEQNKADLASSLQKVAQLEMEFDKYSDALAHFERALELRRMVFGDTHLQLASILKATATIYHEYKHDYKKAISSYTELMRIMKWSRGENHIDVAHASNMLGYIYSNKNCEQYNLSMAVDCHEGALRYMPSNSELTAKALCNIAICYVNILQGEGRHAIPTDRIEKMTDKAIHYLESCIAIYENIAHVSGPIAPLETSELAKSLYYKGVLHMQFSGLSKNSQDDEHAIECFTEALALYRELLKNDSVAHAGATSGVLQKLGMMLLKDKAYDQSLTYFQEALKIREQLQGSLESVEKENKREMAEIYYGMGVVMCERRDRNCEGAMECYKHSLKIRVFVLGPHHIDVAQTLNNIGSVYARMNNFSDAKDYWSRALDIYRSNGLTNDDEKVKCTVANMELANKLVIFPSKAKKNGSLK